MLFRSENRLFLGFVFALTAATTIHAQAPLQTQVSMDGDAFYQEFGPPSAPAGVEYIAQQAPAAYPSYIDSPVQSSLPDVRITLDGFLFSRNGSGGGDPLVLDAPYPAGAPSLYADELDFDGELGGRLDVALGNLHFNYLWTGTASTHMPRTSEPASDILFFNVHDADDSPIYTARYQSRFAVGDLGLRTSVHPFLTVSGGLAMGELSESMDMITSFDPLSGFYSQATNELYGARVAAEAQLWSDGNLRIECGLSGGVYHNEIEVNAQSRNWQETWTDSDVAFSGTANIALVIPAYPVNFRIGYQATAVSGVALLPDQSDSLRLYDGGGSVETDDVLYHGLLFGVEFVR